MAGIHGMYIKFCLYNGFDTWEIVGRFPFYKVLIIATSVSQLFQQLVTNSVLKMQK
jgi:hypothetical protein